MSDKTCETPTNAVADVPAGAWAVGVSGGADSVALLALLRSRPDLHLHVVHLDHQLRGDASTGDASFVRELATSWGLTVTIVCRRELEEITENLPANPSARYRALRHQAFRSEVSQRRLNGVILAHHADDQAETVLIRLLRGSGPAGIIGMKTTTLVHGLRMVRPLLAVARADLRQFLLDLRQPWREDASNASSGYRRNCVRRLLELNGEAECGGSAAGTATAGTDGSADPTRITVAKMSCSEALLDLAARCRALREWVQSTAPRLEPRFAATDLSSLPRLLQTESASRWLIANGVPSSLLQASPKAVDRLIAMATDAAAPHRQSYPGRVFIRRREGILWAEL